MKNMRTIISIFALLVAASGCKDVRKVTNTDQQGASQEYFVHKKTGLKMGPYTARYPNQNLLEEASFVNDTLHGERKVYYETGQLDYLETYQMGQFDGPYQKFNEDGQLVQEGQYTANQMTGLWKGWYDNGQLKEEVTMAENNENGPFKEYHPGGKLMTEGSYLNGDNEDGPLVKYDENGQPVERMYCVYGVCGAVWKMGEGDIALDTAQLLRLSKIKKDAGMEEEEE